MAFTRYFARFRFGTLIRNPLFCVFLCTLSTSTLQADPSKKPIDARQELEAILTAREASLPDMKARVERLAAELEQKQLESAGLQTELLKAKDAYRQAKVKVRREPTEANTKALPPLQQRVTELEQHYGEVTAAASVLSQQHLRAKAVVADALSTLDMVRERISAQRQALDSSSESTVSANPSQLSFAGKPSAQNEQPQEEESKQ
ncbi:hypothetical protein [Marinibactrum halimedae]|uniref:Mechanosensitive ion channel MscS porin domain-containing protein n=1 Tax=Marinibactrum halimedae TaxID=1444977 RepID=A0AA37WQA1_9GAMM|nr:hypothetical protein [Marinibactrum halimedae]MCD9459858.1 hypothetical protein [Marinibactrum halimedae]GLS26947.1 hypothetical protein GCM10007877_26660 [Marinibactrum halimedae]